MKISYFSLIKLTLITIVGVYILFPNFVDSRYGGFVGFVVVVLIVVMIVDGTRVAKKVIKNRSDSDSQQSGE